MIQLHRQFVKVTCAVLLLPATLFAQEQLGTITGRVIDRDSQQPIPSAQVVIVGTQIGSLTDDRGEFRLSRVTPGATQLRALRLGYQAVMQTVTVTAGGTATAPGHRLGDLRRLVRQYGRAANSVFPTGAFSQGGTYGTHVSLPIPFEELNNPLARECDASVP